MAKLYLQRHLKTYFNDEKRFCGWSDVSIIAGQEEVLQNMVSEISNIEIHKIFSSPLYRNLQTTEIILRKLEKYPYFKHIDGGKMQDWGYYKDKSDKCAEVLVSEKLNERFYGDLQGLTHQSMQEKFGDDQVLQWRRSYTVKPPAGESLEDTYDRTVPFYKEKIEEELKAGKNVLVVSSGNALRSIVKYIENISDDKII